METQEIFEQMQIVFRQVFDDDQIVLTPQTTSEDIEDWDSLTHVQLVVALEKHFGVKFTAREMLMWNNVSDIARSIESKK